MYQQLQLDPDELETVFATIDACHRAATESDFTTHVYPRFRQIFPHSSFACGIGSTPENRVIRCLNINFPDDYIRRIVSSDGRLLSPVAQQWLENKTPQFFDLNELPRTPAEAAWTAAVREYGFRNIVAHGLSDIKNKAASYFSLADVAAWGEREASLLQIIVPHLHIALANCSPTLAGATEESVLSERELAVMHWVRAGKSNDEIGVILGISRWTVKIHVRNVMNKLQASTRAQAVAKAMELGIL